MDLELYVSIKPVTTNSKRIPPCQDSLCTRRAQFAIVVESFVYASATDAKSTPLLKGNFCEVDLRKRAPQIGAAFVDNAIFRILAKAAS